jgi:integrase
MLTEIHEHFQNLRSNRMPKNPSIIPEAVAIFKRLYPGQDTHITTEARQNLGPGWVVCLGSQEVLNPNLIAVQERLDEGFQLNAGDGWEFVGVPRQGSVYGYPPPAPLPTPTPAAEPVLALPTEEPGKPEEPTKAVEPARAKKEKKVKSLMLSEAKRLYTAHREAPEDGIHYKPMSKSTLDCDRQALERLSEWLGRDVTVESLLDLDYKPFTIFLMEKAGLSKVSASTRLRFVKAFFKGMKDLGHIDGEPDIRYPRKHGKEKLKTANQPYSNRELQAIFNYIVENRPQKMRDRKTTLELAYLILMFLYTGFRKGEQLSFTKEKIRKIGEVEVFDFTEMSKDNVASIRMVPLHSRLKALGFLKFAGKHQDKIFPIHESNYRKKFTQILTELDIKGASREKTFHSFRATFDSKLQGKIEDSIRHTLMGHTKTGMDNTYLHQLEDEMPTTYKKAIEKLDYQFDVTQLKAYLTQEIAELYP